MLLDLGHRIGSSAHVAHAVLAELAAQSSDIDLRIPAGAVPPPASPYSWFLFGASARRESLTLDFPALAAVYDDSADPHAAAQTRAWLEAVAAGLLEWTHGNLPCRSVSEWRALYDETIRNPLREHLYTRRELFNIKPLCGDLALVESLSNHVLHQLCDNKVAVALLANETLVNLPPLTFFDGLVLNPDGEQSEDVDLDRSAISPLADAARVFAIKQGHLTVANTQERLQAATFDYPEQAHIFIDATAAFRIALYQRMRAGNSRIVPLQLGTFDRRLLTTAFSSIGWLLEFTASAFVQGD